jgi:hypothetical protein
MNDERAVSVRRYFSATPRNPGLRTTDNERVMMLAGGVLGFVGLILLFTGGLGRIIGGVLTVVGLTMTGVSYQRTKEIEMANLLAERDYQTALRSSEPKPSDEQMDHWLDESLSRAVDVAWRELGLKSLSGPGSAELQIIGVPRHAVGLTARVGADGRMRLSSYELTICCLSDRKLSVFQCTLSMATGGLRHVTTHEFYRQHISLLKTERELTAFPVLLGEGLGGLPDSQIVLTRRFEIGVGTDSIKTDIGVSPPAAPNSLEWMTYPGIQAIEEIRRQLDWSAARES